jgi:hypothetical protein
MYNLKHRELQEGEFWREIPAFAKVSQDEFLDYKWQIKNSISNLTSLIETIKTIVSDDFLVAISKGFDYTGKFGRTNLLELSCYCHSHFVANICTAMDNRL